MVEGKPESWGEAVEMAREILKPFVPRHPRIRLFIGFHVEPALYMECTHVETPEEALREAVMQDRFADAVKPGGEDE